MANEATKDVLPVPPILSLIVEGGQIDEPEAYRVFNMGIGMVWIVPAESAEKAISICGKQGFLAKVCGKVVPGNKKVVLE